MRRFRQTAHEEASAARAAEIEELHAANARIATLAFAQAGRSPEQAADELRARNGESQQKEQLLVVGLWGERFATRRAGGAQDLSGARAVDRREVVMLGGDRRDRRDDLGGGSDALEQQRGVRRALR